MTATASTSRTARARAVDARTALTPDSWIEAATDVLVDQGIDHVRVEVLASRLGVTRGSFYWHFRDRGELLRAVLQTWRRRMTEDLTVRLERAHADAREQLRDVLTLPYRGRAAARAARIELAIRAWARRDDMARYAVNEADASRLGYIAQIFSALGFDPVEARTRAALAYSLVVLESMAPAVDLPKAQREARDRSVEALLTQPLRTTA